MAYCTSADVAAEFKFLTISSSSAVTTTVVTEFISQADAYLNSRVGLKYIVPITGTESLKIMKRLSIWFTAARIKDLITVKLGQPIGEQQTREGDLYKMVNDELDLIVKGLLLLSDSTSATTADGVRSFDVDDSQEFEFDRNSDQW